MTRILKQYKLPTGEVHYPALLAVPISERLPAMIEKDFIQATVLVVGALTMAFEKLSVKKKIDGALVNNIADEIIDTCEQDRLSMEDLLVFLQRFVRGEFGDINDISVSKFMICFDKFRDERWDAGVALRDERDEYFKKLGDDNEYERTYTKDPSPFGMQLEHWRNKSQAKSDEMKLLKREAREK